MTANDIDVLIHYYVCASPHPRISALAVRDSVNKFVKDGILVETEMDEYDVTPKGTVFVDRILDVKYPELMWTYKKGG